jgi:putative polyhydroxyalkanoate system protein
LPDIRVQRTHDLGIDRARDIADRWVDEARNKFGLECTYEKGEARDQVSFARPGVSGTLVVAGDEFALDAKLGFLLGTFKDRIEEEISRNLDALLAGEQRNGAA